MTADASHKFAGGSQKERAALPPDGPGIRPADLFPDWYLRSSATDPELVAGNSAFAFKLYSAVRQVVIGNVLISPYSISQALAMTYAGARGATAAQMADALSLTLDQPALHEAFQNLTADLVEHGNRGNYPDRYEAQRALRIANALWGEQSYPFSPSYNAQLTRYYGAALHEADFVNEPEAACKRINDWIADQTNGRIRNTMPVRFISPLTVLVLANAVWFYGSWQHPFSRRETRDQSFFLVDGAAATVPFMFQRGRFGYGRGEDYQLVELPYEQSDFAFVVILPDEGQFESVEARLAGETLEAAINQLTHTDMMLHLPKFAFGFGTIELIPALQSLGMADAFDPKRADFSGMVEGTPPVPLVVGNVLHKTRIGVDENGTEAAAATAVTMLAGGLTRLAPEPLEVRIDRPFLFAIRDTETGTLLFLGRVMDPRA